MTRNVQRIITIGAAIAILMLLGFMARPAAAACSNAKIVFYEDPHQVSDGTNPLSFCYPTNSSYLGNYAAAPDNDCKALLVNRTNWNDCASSWTFTGWGLAAGGCYAYGVTVYRDSNYGTVIWSTWGSASYGGGALEDTASSVKFKYRTTCPS